MPVDADGVSADIVVDKGSIASRMNIGRLYYQYVAGASRFVQRNLKNMLGVDKKTITVNELSSRPIELINEAYAYLLKFYKIVSEKQYEYFNSISEEDKIDYLAYCINKEVYVYSPIEDAHKDAEMIAELEREFKPTYGPVSYVGNSGKRCLTKDKIRIAPVYMMLLEKIADTWSSTSTGKIHVSGVLSPITRQEKYKKPFRESATRTIGETELRIYTSYCGVNTIAEMLDRSNNHPTQRAMVKNILKADKPTDIDYVVDRSVIKLGGSKPLQLVKHMFLVMGFKPTYESEEV